MSQISAATAAIPVRAENAAETATIRKIAWRIVPLVTAIYLAASLDRANVSFAALTMNKDLDISALIYGWGAGIYFIGTFLTGVPSNMLFERVGARRTLASIAFVWGFVAAAQVLISGAHSFLVMRLLLGLAEAGLFPVVVLYLALWFPAGYRARVMALFMLANPLSSAIGGILAGPLLMLDGIAGLHGWQWMFLLESLPPFALAILVLAKLTDRPEDAAWLRPDERAWLVQTQSEQRAKAARIRVPAWRTLMDPTVTLFAAIYFGRMMTLFGVTFFLPLIFKGLGLTATMTGYLAAIPFSAGVIGMLVWAHYSDRAADRRWHLLATHLVSAAALGVAAWCGTSFWSVLAMSVASIGFSAQAGCFWSIPSMVLTPGMVAVAVGWINSVGVLGAIAGPFSVGLAKDWLGSYTPGIYLMAALIGGVGLLVFCLPQPGRRPA